MAGNVDPDHDRKRCGERALAPSGGLRWRCLADPRSERAQDDGVGNPDAPVVPAGCLPECPLPPGHVRKRNAPLLRSRSPSRTPACARPRQNFRLPARPRECGHGFPRSHGPAEDCLNQPLINKPLKRRAPGEPGSSAPIHEDERREVPVFEEGEPCAETSLARDAGAGRRRGRVAWTRAASGMPCTTKRTRDMPVNQRLATRSTRTNLLRAQVRRTPRRCASWCPAPRAAPSAGGAPWAP